MHFKKLVNLVIDMIKNDFYNFYYFLVNDYIFFILLKFISVSIHFVYFCLILFCIFKMMLLFILDYPKHTYFKDQTIN